MTDHRDSHFTLDDRANRLDLDCACDMRFTERSVGTHVITRRAHRNGCELGHAIDAQLDARVGTSLPGVSRIGEGSGPPRPHCALSDSGGA